MSLDRPDELDEELRLLYVALTRAENRLFVSYPVLQQRPRFGDCFSKPSRFLEELPEHRGMVDMWDFILLKVSYGKVEGSLEYNTEADFNCDGSIDAFDFNALKKNYGK